LFLAGYLFSFYLDPEDGGNNSLLRSSLFYKGDSMKALSVVTAAGDENLCFEVSDNFLHLRSSGRMCGAQCCHIALEEREREREKFDNS
jgi:hypothetical protein